MNITQRINLLSELRQYLIANTEEFNAVKEKAYQQNGWFISQYIDISVQNICNAFLEKGKLTEWVSSYNLPGNNFNPRKIGLVLAGNIPLVGFHDILSCFIAGNIISAKLSSKDSVLIKHIVEKMTEWEPAIKEYIFFADRTLKDCDAYIATGSNNSSRHFEYYFSKYPHIIRKNKTSVAILDGSETEDELQLLADDIMLYFGLGCRNVTQIYIPRNYDFIPLFNAFKKYQDLIHHHKYKNNYDYNLALHILNNVYYMTNELLLFVENKSPFSPIAQIHYQYYENIDDVKQSLLKSEDIQALVGHFGIPFGKAQQPSLRDYADNVDTIKWLQDLNS